MSPGEPERGYVLSEMQRHLIMRGIHRLMASGDQLTEYELRAARDLTERLGVSS